MSTPPDEAANQEVGLARELKAELAAYVDPEWYLTEYQDGTSAGADPVAHFVTFGFAQGRRPNEFFEPAWYLSAYPDVAAEPAILHYIRVGWREGRDPGPRFSLRQYLAAYPDVAAGTQDPLVHYLQHGRQEGRRTFSAAGGDARIDQSEYAQKYPHDREAFSKLMHIIYANFLHRAISEAEIDHYFSGYQAGEDFIDVLFTIQNSEEAKRARQRRSESSLIADGSIQLRDVELIDIIARAHEYSLGRSASSEELSSALSNVRLGGLGDFLSELASREDAIDFARRRSAQQDRGAFSRAVQTLYRTILGRPITEAEIDHYFRGYKAGEDFIEVLLSIEDSPEARAARQTTRDLAIWAPGTSLHLLHDDIMNTIAQAYELHLGRQASFAEVYERLLSLRKGLPLSRVIHLIATSEEAWAFKKRDVRRSERDQFGNALKIAYKALLGRDISEPEIEQQFQGYTAGTGFIELFLAIHGSEEAQKARQTLELSEFSDGKFIQLLFEIILLRAASPSEITIYQDLFAKGSIVRSQLVLQFFRSAAQQFTERKSVPTANDPTTITLFGQKRLLTSAQWEERARELSSNSEQTSQFVLPGTRFAFSSKVTPLISIITSLYKGGDYISHFLENITSQSVFANHCELLIIDANSPEDEYSIIHPYAERFPNIRYKRFDYRLGIYEAWNYGVQNARGSYCTNANLDDCRRHDSLELQAATLDALPFVDVVYQDVMYSFEKNASFEEVARYGFSTKLPIISRYNLMEFNSPHNAPMWRKKLHDEVGLFDPKYRSAGDYEFWMRVLCAGKRFYKLNDPHVIYFVNPQGLSTRADTAGATESHEISRKYFRKLISSNVTIDRAVFLSKLADFIDGEGEGASRYQLVQAALRRASIESRKVSELG
jgi:glycosyltransferase involved in cell wall biosynthesis